MIVGIIVAGLVAIAVGALITFLILLKKKKKRQQRTKKDATEKSQQQNKNQPIENQSVELKPTNPNNFNPLAISHHTVPSRLPRKTAEILPQFNKLDATFALDG
jgi:flagellar basal body-associated protein FliL